MDRSDRNILTSRSQLPHSVPLMATAMGPGVKRKEAGVAFTRGTSGEDFTSIWNFKVALQDCRVIIRATRAGRGQGLWATTLAPRMDFGFLPSRPLG